MRPANLNRLVLILLLLTSVPVMAQVTIKGVVKDNKNNPVAGASISIKDSYDGTTSDSAGRYSFKTSEKGQQVLQVTSIGYKTVEQSVKIEGSSLTIDIDELFSQLDANSDGSIDKEETAALAPPPPQGGPGGPGGAKPEELFGQLDSDGDGSVGLADDPVGRRAGDGVGREAQ